MVMVCLDKRLRNRVAAKRKALEAALVSAGRVTVSETVDVSLSSEMVRRYDRAVRKASELRDGTSERTLILYHTTSPAAARNIIKEGFRLGSKKGASGGSVGAFGIGVNLGKTTEQALLYADERRTSCTLICLAHIGRCHANQSVIAPGERYSTPVHLSPKPGFHSMHGAGRTIFVVPDPARVLPLAVVCHRRPSKKQLDNAVT